MTNKEAIFELIKYRRRLEEDPTIIFGHGAFDAEPFDMAIEALKAQRDKNDCEYCVYMNPRTCDCDNFTCEKYKRRAK